MTCENILHFPPDVGRALFVTLRFDCFYEMNADSASGVAEATGGKVSQTT
jgi:hypothetical protein